MKKSFKKMQKTSIGEKRETANFRRELQKTKKLWKK